MARRQRSPRCRGGMNARYMACALLMAVLGLLAGIMLSSSTGTSHSTAVTARYLQEEPPIHETSIHKQEEGGGGESSADGGGEQGPEGGLEWEESLSLTDLRVIIGIALVLILLTISFELLKESLEESVPDDYEIILEKFFGELTVLGFLSMMTFLISKTGILEHMSEHLFEEEDELLEYVEFVHFALFFIMIAFVIQVLAMIWEAEAQEEQWTEIDDAIRHGRTPAADSSEEEEQVLSKWQGREWYTLIGSRVWSSAAAIQAREEAVFRFLRREFILDRSLDPPFAPKDPAKRVEDSFNFGRYLGLAQIHLLSHAVEVQQKTWLFFAVMAIAFYFIAKLVHEKVMALGWVWVGLGWIVFLGNFVLVAHLLKLRNSYLPNPRDQSEESTNLLNGSASHGDDRLPRWCFVDLDKYNKNRPWMAKCIVGGVPNRQQANFWMDRHGPKYFIALLQVNLIFAGIYAGLLLLEFIPFAYHEVSLSVFVLYTILAILPLLGILYKKKDIVAMMAQVSSIGTYRKDQIARDVLLEETTTRIVRTFLIIQRLRHVAELGHPGHGDEHSPHPTMTPNRTSFSDLEKMQVGHTFDAFDSDKSGHISKDEFHSLLNRLGADMPDAKFDQLVQSLDTDGDGTVTRDEFIHWYQYHSEHDHISLSERAEDLFEMFDENHSGEITLGEFKTRLDSLNMGFTTDEIGAILNILDHDRSGSVSLEEFEVLLHEYYPKELRRQMNH